MRQAMLVVLALLLCAGTGWSIVNLEGQRANRKLAGDVQMYWRQYQSALDGVYLGHKAAWHRLSLGKIFLQKALDDADAMVDLRDPVSARQLGTICRRVKESFHREESRLRDNILNQGDRKLPLVGKE